MNGPDLNQTLLAGVSTVQLQTWLTEAQTAYHDVSSGGKAVTVIVTGGGQHREVHFDKTNLSALENWIRMLQVQLGIVTHSRRAISLRF